jgi:hypothetical protein
MTITSARACAQRFVPRPMHVFAGRCFVLAFACLAATAARSAELTLFTNAPPGSPLVITTLNTSGELLVSVANADADDLPADYLTGWQFRLEVVPAAGAVGALHFGTGSEPDNYVLADVTHLGPSSATVNEVFSALDVQFSFPSSGVPVPTAPGANLLSISFAPETNTLGMFGIYAQDGSESFWLDAANDPNNHAREFVNIPDDGNLVHIADVLVTSVADYNLDGSVDAADYTLWRDALSQMDGDLAADGNDNGEIDEGDFLVWREHFGESAGSGAASALLRGDPSAVPEPPTTTLLCLVVLAAVWNKLRSGRAACSASPQTGKTPSS